MPRCWHGEAGIPSSDRYLWAIGLQRILEAVHLRILLTTGIFPPDIGGPASYVPRMAAALADRGHEVAVVTLADAPATSDAYPFPVSRIRRGIFRPMRFLRTIGLIWFLARRADLIFASGLFFESAIAGALARKPLIEKIVGDWAWERARNQNATDCPLEDFQQQRQTLRWEFAKAIRSLAIRRAKVIIVPSRYLAGIVRTWGVHEAGIRVVYNALENLPDSDPVLLPTCKGRTLLTIARLVPWKGIPGLLELTKNKPKARLLIVGDGPERSMLEEAARTLRIADRVLFLGNLTRRQVAACLRASDLFILNSTYEGLPHVILEAFAAGLPVIATAVGGTVELVETEKNGLLIAPHDPAALATAVDRILGDRPLRDRLIEGGRRTLRERFQWKDMVDRTEFALVEYVKPGAGAG